MKTIVGVLGFLTLSLAFCEVLSNQLDIFRSLHQEPPPPQYKRNRLSYTESWIDQLVDNFNDSNNATYRMRYMANAEFYQPGGPFFIFVGGEWEISPGWIANGHMYDMAKEMNGYLFYPEHRYYGQSHPTPDLSFDNLKYLHVNQALADLAHFIRTKKQDIPGASNSGVILVGASYAATMVTWFRQRYPELANGAWSSSAPLLAQADFPEYFETVGQSIKKVGGDGCYKRLEGAFSEMERLVEVGDLITLSQKLNHCHIVSQNQVDIWYLFSSLSSMLAGVVQNHRPGDIEGVCKTIMSGDTDVDGFAQYVRERMNDCWTSNYTELVDYYRETSWTSQAATGMRQWRFQTCNEFGWYQTSGSPNQPFGSSFPVDFSYQWCHDIFDKSFYNESINHNVYTTNQDQNGMKPNITNVYSTHGELDPWRRMGVQEDVNPTAPTYVIPMVSHCNDLYSINKNDSPEMLSSKKKTTSLVKQWLAA